MTEQSIALVTGSARGIGYEVAAGLGALGWSVGIADLDDDARQAAVTKLVETGIDGFDVPLDVTSDDSVARVVQLLESRAGRLDVLVNNAGATGGKPQQPSLVSPDQIRAAVEVNVIGMVRLTNALLPLLRRSEHPRIVNQSSHVGSLTLQITPGVELGEISGAYAPTKSYLNAVTIQYAKELADTNILINNACPGYVSTELTEFQGFRTPEEGAVTAIRLATLPDDGPTGQLFDDDGPVPW